LFTYLGGIIREMRGTALIVNGTADHVHALVRVRPAHSAAEIARVIKANSSGWVRAKWSSDFDWQIGYGAFSVSESNVGTVTKYIATQEEHHKKHSFQEELSSVPQKERRGLRREIPLGLVSVAPFGVYPLLHHYPRLAPWAAFLRRFAAGFTSRS
jgi:putative transposase